MDVQRQLRQERSGLVIHPRDAGDSAIQMRLDAAGVLKRFHYLERAMVLTYAGWIPAVHSIEAKALLARLAWQSSLTADALRTRVFELKYPSRMLERGDDEPLVRAFEAGIHAPSSQALMKVMAEVYVPALARAERAYLDASDDLADAPSRRFLELAVKEKEDARIALLATALAEADAVGERADDALTVSWLSNVATLVARLGGVGLTPPTQMSVPDVIDGGAAFAVPADPGRDARYFPCNFYWPDTLQPDFAYGSGLTLQVRVAVSHLNEVWAVETAGAALYLLAGELGWEFVCDAARWTYDESRHMQMGQRRLAAWGLEPADVPLGRFIFDAARDGGDPIYRIGMLGFFETKNIGKKRDRARAFEGMGDVESERDMEFDWADETIHAEYGRRWLKRLLVARGRSSEDWSAVLAECERLVDARKAVATEAEAAAIRDCATRLLARAEQLATAQP
jgi:uncharacterized ferritin-like protein (DUF455 family)